MRKYLLLVVLASWTSIVSASNFDTPTLQSKDRQQLIHEVVPAKPLSSEVAQRGCCSHHGGVSGCSGGSVTCVDGSFSPSCTCDHEEPPHVDS